MLAFDLPTSTKAERKAATRFRHQLLDEGFEMAQYSVYLRYCGSTGMAKAITRRISLTLPDRGKIDILQFTDKQYENIVRFDNSARKKMKQEPQLLLL